MPVGASPAWALAPNFTPARLSARSNASAVNWAGLAWKYGARTPVRPWLYDSALSGPTSLVSRKFEAGTPRKASNADSSPST
jgi:hypothetical protein